MTEPKDPVVEKVSDHLKQQTLALDQETERQLNAIRAEAVSLAEQEVHGGWFARAGYAAAFSLAVVAGLWVLNAGPTEEIQNPSALELVLLNEDFEMLEEELAFYSWAEAELEDSPKG